MTAKEWTNQADKLVDQALVAAQGKDINALRMLENTFLAHKQQQVPGVPNVADTAFRNAMYALFDAIVSNVVNDWDGLAGDLKTSAAALDGMAEAAKQTATILSLQPVVDIAKSLGEIVNEVKELKTNPASADNVAQKIQNVSEQLQNLIVAAKVIT